MTNSERRVRRSIERLFREDLPDGVIPDLCWERALGKPDIRKMIESDTVIVTNPYQIENPEMYLMHLLGSNPSLWVCELCSEAVQYGRKTCEDCDEFQAQLHGRG